MKALSPEIKKKKEKMGRLVGQDLHKLITSVKCAFNVCLSMFDSQLVNVKNDWLHCHK